MLLVRSLMLAVAVAALVGGCGDSAVRVDPAATYSAASLARELVFRYKGLDPKRRDARKPAPAPKLGKAATKVAAAPTKDEPAATLDEVIRETRVKAALVPGTTVPAVIRDVAAAVANDSTLPAADRKTIVDRLNVPEAGE